jgi:hypothetical protein
MMRAKRKAPAPLPADGFDAVKAIALQLPDVEAATRYDGSPVLKAGGCFMAAPATHPSAEPATLVVRIGLEERTWFLEEAPETYYVTEHYRPHPVVLVRLTRIDRDALRDLLSVSRSRTLGKRSKRPRRRHRGEVAESG